jgi:thioester reductase-like protein
MWFVGCFTARVRANLEARGAAAGADWSRVKALAGDVTLPFFGVKKARFFHLAGVLDAIYLNVRALGMDVCGH